MEVEMAATRPPEIDPQAPLLFVVNAASGHNDPAQTRSTIESALKSAGRRADFFSARGAEVTQFAAEAAERAMRTSSAVIAVGGDGTINAVAQAAHSIGCAMGFVPQGTFNYFARTHAMPLTAEDAMPVLLRSRPEPVQVGLVNDRIFLVNASVGLYPELLEDREQFKSRFGRNRFVAGISALSTLLTTHRPLHLRIELDGVERDAPTPTLFVGNNRLQLEQLGLPESKALEQGRVAGVMLRKATTPALLWLWLRGAFGSLGEADTVETFSFDSMTVRQRRWGRQTRLKVARDGEVSRMRSPLEIRVAPTPLFLIKPDGESTSADRPDARA